MDIRKLEYEAPRLIEGLIDAWSRLQSVQRWVEKHEEENPPPEVPQKFESISSLIEYNVKRRHYEDQVRQRTESASRAQANFDSLAGEVIPMLPEGVPLVHEYQTHGSEFVGKRFEIVNASLEDGPSIQVQELED